VAKDDVKEAIADILGTGDREHSRALGRAAYAVMRSVVARSLESGGSVVFEANFHHGESEPWLRELAAIADTRVLICRTPLEENRRRFAVRRRHPVHIDDLEEEWPPEERFALQLGVPTLVVDTTSGYAPDLEMIVRFIA
jgi:predicted kinase